MQRVEALSDWALGLARWHLWTALAWNDVRRRYRRSAIGQFWLTLSMGITITGLGTVYSLLFHVPVTEFIPYVAVCFVVWGFISNTILESCTAFVDNEAIMKYTYTPRSTFIFRLLYRNTIVFAHNVLIVPLVFLFFRVALSWNMLWFVPGALLVLLNCFCIGLVLAIICARYRDLPQIVSSVMQIVFFVTPVMFKPTQLPAWSGPIVRLNPFANLLEVVRDPLLGQMPSAWAFGYCAISLAIAGLIASYFTRNYGARVVYWL
jgi:lipopolysaccharide transport system permease protein